ncbi:glutamate 5-kinase [Nesterenkonia sp. MY13]|uniref:Glutamate 5-kinase n=1 Tax=Nesterenkonia sedimenti TaxID=1463632 RepID=A0A7X8YCN5_9MICC|nr:glutamate 5-kinase [Nesterenkonia sedimenti]NLS08620.1 glutamate 5-kinase [Nesterenkonia sedimenti]
MNFDITSAKRLVIKVGSSSLTTLDGGISVQSLNRLVDACQKLRDRGTEVVLVSSGAIAAGLAPLRMERRPHDLAAQQAAAAVGQGELMAHYSRAFAHHGAQTGQLLLTVEDLIRRSTYVNALRALEKLLALGVVPIINENDAVATAEIRFGDNDRLAALTANLIHADGIILLSDVDALYSGPPSEGGKRISRISSPEDLEGVTLGPRGRAGIGTGGMTTKVEAAQLVTANGIPARLTSAAQAPALFDGEEIGTLFLPRGKRRGARSAWLAHLANSQGSITIDDGAVEAVIGDRRSLLAAGITSVGGEFEAGDVVEIRDPAGEVRARGLTSFSASETRQMQGKKTAQLGEELGEDYQRPVIHTDDMARVEVHR